VTICGLCIIYLFLQGYDDILKELPDPEAKKVVTKAPAFLISVL
jgi:hypothetical protein